MPRLHVADTSCWCRPEIHRTPDGITVRHKGKDAPTLQTEHAPYTPEEARAIIGQRISQHRQLKGWSQSELARRSGLAQPAVNQIENTGKQLTIENLLKISTALGVDGGVLVGDLEIR